MTQQSRIRRMGWLAVLLICACAYALLHLKVTSVQADVVKAEREIVALEHDNLLLETEYLTRSSQMRLAAWNRVDFGFVAPRAEQFIERDRQLAAFGSPRSVNAPAPIMLAGMTGEEDMPEFPQLVSPLTGEPVDARLLSATVPAENEEQAQTRLAATVSQAPLRIALTATAGDAGE